MNSCDTCVYYQYDEDEEAEVCEANMDEDDYVRLRTQEYRNCPFYRSNDDYKIVRHQM